MRVVVAEINPTGVNLLFSSRIGSGVLDTSNPAGLAGDFAGNIYLASDHAGPNLILITTAGAFQTNSNNSLCCNRGFVAKIAPTVLSPQISAGRVVDAATFQTSGIAPNEFISIIGTGLGPVTGVAAAMATLLAGTRIYIGGTEALPYAQDGQVNALVPFEVPGTQTTVQAEFNGVKGNSVTVAVAGASPGIFTQAYGPGQAWMVNQDGTFHSSSNLLSGTVTWASGSPG